jgi:hypothetical protein
MDDLVKDDEGNPLIIGNFYEHTEFPRLQYWGPQLDETTGDYVYMFEHHIGIERGIVNKRDDYKYITRTKLEQDPPTHIDTRQDEIEEDYTDKDVRNDNINSESESESDLEGGGRNISKKYKKSRRSRTRRTRTRIRRSRRTRTRTRRTRKSRKNKK